MLAPVCAAIRDNIFRASFSVVFFCATNERSSWITPHKSIFSVIIPRFPILLFDSRNMGTNQEVLETEEHGEMKEAWMLQMF